MAVEETEYAGFIPTQPINWADLTEDLAGKVYQIGEERQKKREELDKIAADNQKILNSWEPGKNQTLNQLVLRGADQGRTLIKQWNDQLKAGQISATDYKNRMNNVSEYWGILANSAKTYDARYLEIVKRQQEGVASEFEIEMYNMFGNMSNLSDMTTQFDDEGRVYMAKTDPRTGKIIGDLYDVRTMNIPDNIYANKVKVNEQVTGLIKDWEPKTIFKDLGRGGELNIESVKKQDSYKVMVERVVNTVAPDSNPRAQISVLVDNGVIPAPDYYRTPEEYTTKKEQAIQREIQIKQQAGVKDVNLTKDELAEIELSLVQVTQDRGGLIIPILNEQQRNAAKDRARGEVDIQLAEKISGSPQQRWTTGGGGDGGNPKEVDATLRDILVEAWSGGPGSINTLNANLRDKGFEFKPGGRNPQGQFTMKLVSRRPDAAGNEVVIVPASANLNDFDPYFYGTGATAAKTAKKQREASTVKPTKKSTIPSASRAEWIKNGWNNAQINEAVKLGKIKVI